MNYPPQRTAVLVIDMQNDFCAATGAMATLGADVRRNADVARRLPDFLPRARAAGCLVVWVRQAAHDQLVSPARRARAEAMGRDPLSVCAAGSWGAELADGLHPEPGDCHLEKTRYSAFVGTPLHNLLRAHGRDHVVVVGTAANVCVDSTIRDAYMADLAATMPTDLVGWTRADLAEPAVRNLGFYFCETTTSTELVSAWSAVDRVA
ncbi:cysteine hydrolase [Micromonospora fluostatini]|uniref:Cysteine hydrolase n=1 Tax=Micromonospora fluostatini TaxID=1629071 RepID=A0ABY2DLM2_9ACTN|nr:cysteine hydrolase [Micromonospora fluostatini]